MQLKYKALRLAVLASFAISGAAMAQTPPADQSQTPSQNPPGPVNPQDQSTVASPQTGAAETTGVELGSGWWINALAPEDAAAALRDPAAVQR